MLFANITLMTAPIAHLLGHIPSTWVPVGGDAAVAILNISFLLAPFAFDYLTEKRVRFLTTGLAIGLFASLVLQASVIDPSAAWDRFAVWISQ